MLPILRPGQTHQAVPRLKKALIRELRARHHEGLANAIVPNLRTYGGHAVDGVKRFQRDKGLKVDGIVGKDTWRGLGFDEPIEAGHPMVLTGIPFEPGLVALDGHWVTKPLGQVLLDLRRAGKWRGRVNSGYRPAWYQKKLWDAAVRKYGSEQAASKWVARPGTSRHGRKGAEGAADVSLGDQADRAGLFRPMSWEPWHVQLQTTAGSHAARAAGAPFAQEEAEVEEGAQEDVEPPSEKQLEALGVTMEDVDDSVQMWLDKFDDDFQLRDPEATAVDDGFDPEEAERTEPQLAQ